MAVIDPWSVLPEKLLDQPLQAKGADERNGTRQ
jgi:hypothetical protein